MPEFIPGGQMPSPPVLSVVIPAFNEADCIHGTLLSLRDYLETVGVPWEIIVSDDGSEDTTAVIARGEVAAKPGRVHLVQSTRNMGKGFAVRAGVRAARGEYVLFTDADLSTPPDQIGPALDLLRGGSDLVIGVRRHRGDGPPVSQPASRRIFGGIFNLFVRGIGLTNVLDTQCGFKGFTRRAADLIFERQLASGFAFDVEILLIARRLGLSTVQLPIPWTHHATSTVRPVRDALRMLRELTVIKANDLRRRYGAASGRRVTAGSAPSGRRASGPLQAPEAPPEAQTGPRPTE